MFSGIGSWVRSNPRPVFLIVAGLVIFGLFLGVISPLFATAGPAKADITGVIPSTATAGKPLEIDVSIDNVGDSAIGQVCVGVLVQGPLTPVDVIFQNIDREPFVGGTACGGQLTSQSSTPVQLFFTATSAGPAQLVVSPKDGPRVIGAALTGSLSVQNP